MTFNGTVSGTQPYIIQVVQGANELSDGLLGTFILITIWLIVYYANRNGTTGEAIVSASWTTLIVALLLALVGIVNSVELGTCVALAVLSLLFKPRAY